MDIASSGKNRSSRATHRRDPSPTFTDIQYASDDETLRKLSLIRAKLDAITYDKERFEQFFEYSLDACLITDSNLIIQQINSAAARILNSENAFGQAIYEYFRIDKGIIEQLRSAVWVGSIDVVVMQIKPYAGRAIAARIVRLKVGPHLYNCWMLRPQDAIPAQNIERAYGNALASVAATLNSTLNLDEVLERMLENVGKVVAHDAANVMLVSDGIVKVVGCRGYEHRNLHRFMLSLHYPLNQSSQPSNNEPIDLLPFSYWRDIPELMWIKSNIGAPIRIEGQVIGFLNLDSTISNFFDADTSQHLQAFADQAAIAIQNARLYSQAQQAAVLEERQRLARELHDAVSQTLWSACLITEILPDLWERDSVKGAQKLKLLDQLIHGALDEMRALLLELVPSTLIEVGLDESLRRLVGATEYRSDIKIVFVVNGEPQNIPGEVQTTLYRITQEALNNIMKHSGASQASVVVVFTSNSVSITISDNGRGFEMTKLPKEHFGLGFMQERMNSINGSLTITSKLGHGTNIIASWSSWRGTQYDGR